MITSIFTDIDGTLLDAEDRYSPLLKNEIIRVQSMGATLHMCTNRSYNFVAPLQIELGYTGTMILEDGSLLYSESGLERLVDFEANTLGATAVQIIESQLGYRCRLNNSKMSIASIYISDPSDPKRSEKVKESLALVKNHLTSQNTHIYDTGRGNIIIKHIDAHKALGVLKVLGSEQSVKNSMYIGDGINDVGAMRFVNEFNGVTIAPANAVPQIKELASVVTNGSCSDGVIEALRYFIR